MAEAAVAFVVERLASLLHEEMKLLGGVREELIFITDELKLIQGFLRDADEKDKSSATMAWVRQVRETSYEIEDILDEFIIRQSRHNLNDSRSLFHGISSLTTNLKSRHQLASGIRSVRSKMDVISRARVNFCLGEKDWEASSKSQIGWYDRRLDSLLLDESDVVGMESPKEYLLDWMINGSDRRNIALVGMGGVGKTTLAKMVYDDLTVKKHFQCRAWINVSQSFKLDYLLMKLLEQISGVGELLPQEMESMSVLGLSSIIRTVLQSKRFLVVLDDVWHESLWDALKPVFPNGGRGSRVLLTTRRLDLASYISVDSDRFVYQMQPLSLEDSWNLLRRKAFLNRPCPPELVQVSEKILQKCGGLPIAIVAISGVLATKRNHAQEWEMVYRTLGNELESNSSLTSIVKILSLSYIELPYYLKSCIMYLCMFPENCLIGRNRLIRLWIAEGFVKEKQGMTPEEVAEDYLKELLNRSLVQVAEATIDGRIKTCRIHDLLREVILTKLKEQSFAEIFKSKDHRFSEIAKLQKVRRLSVNSSSQSVEQIHLVSHLRSLLMFWDVSSSLDHPAFLMPYGNFKFLRVLDLTAAPLDVFPAEIGKMVLLKYLSLKSTKLSSVPRSIGKLQHLETLDLKHSLVTTLPSSILKLQKLHHLLVYSYQNGTFPRFHMKRGFRCSAILKGMESLQSLCFIEADHDGHLILKELGMFRQLRRLGIVKLRRDDGILLCSSLEKLQHLRALSVTSIEEDEIIDMKILSSPPPFLQRLYLSGRLESLPEWIRSLKSLTRLQLKWSRLSDDPLKLLQHLPNLTHLELLQVYGGNELIIRAEGFLKLKFLVVDQFDRLEAIDVIKGALPSLEELVLQRCKLLKRVPLGIEHLTNLKVLRISDMPEDFIKALHPRNEDHHKVAHVPEVYIWCDGERQAFTFEKIPSR